MALGDSKGGSNYGNKGSKHGYEFSHLTHLKNINTTLQAILSSNGVGKDFETVLIKDNTGTLYLEARIFDNDLGTWTVEHYAPGSTTPATPTAPLTYLEAEDASESTLQLAVWDQIIGNSKEITYYAAGPTPAENPSGNKNVQSVIYKEGVSTIITQTFTYDVDDDVLTITAS
jgi:hypothetical protein